MASLSGNFSGPSVTPSVSYTAGGAVFFSLDGEWSRAIINTEVSADAGATWKPVWVDYGIRGASYADPLSGVVPPHPPGAITCRPPGSGLFRLRCVEFGSGSCSWTLST